MWSGLIAAFLMAGIAFPAVAEVVIWQESFDTDPFNSSNTGRWRNYTTTWADSWNGLTHSATGGQSGGFIQRPHAGDRWTVYHGTPFTTDGYMNLKLTYWFMIQPDYASNRYIQTWVIRNGVWTNVHTQYGPYTSWTKVEIPLTGTITGIRYLVASGHDRYRRIDSISITGDVVPEPSSLLALATGSVGMVGFAIRRRR